MLQITRNTNLEYYCNKIVADNLSPCHILEVGHRTTNLTADIET